MIDVLLDLWSRSAESVELLRYVIKNKMKNMWIWSMRFTVTDCCDHHERMHSDRQHFCE